jgi:toxin ParE1/3/4
VVPPSSSTAMISLLEAAHEHKMVPKLEISPKARQDLDGIWDYVARRNPGAATGLLLRISSALGVLSEHPRLGTPRPELGARLRSHVIRPFVVYYRPLPDRVLVMRILHQARDILPRS